MMTHGGAMEHEGLMIAPHTVSTQPTKHMWPCHHRAWHKDQALFAQEPKSPQVVAQGRSVCPAAHLSRKPQRLGTGTAPGAAPPAACGGPAGVNT